MTQFIDFSSNGLFSVAIIMLLGFVFFLTGAIFWKPKVYEQPFATSLPAMHKDKKRMRWIYYWMIAGIATSACGWLTFILFFWKENDHVFSPSAGLLFVLGAALMMVSIGFRLTVQEDAAKETEISGNIPSHYSSFQNWAGLLYSLHMVFSFISWTLIGVSILLTKTLPVSLGWAGVIGGIICSLGFITFRNGPFAPPILAHLYSAVIAVIIISSYL